MIVKMEECKRREGGVAVSIGDVGKVRKVGTDGGDES